MKFENYKTFQIEFLVRSSTNVKANYRTVQLKHIYEVNGEPTIRPLHEPVNSLDSINGRYDPLQGMTPKFKRIEGKLRFHRIWSRKLGRSIQSVHLKQQILIKNFSWVENFFKKLINPGLPPLWVFSDLIYSQNAQLRTQKRDLARRKVDKSPSCGLNYCNKVYLPSWTANGHARLPGSR